MEDQIITAETEKLLREIIDFPWDILNPKITQTRLQRWLRENYDFHIVIEPLEDEDGSTTYECGTISDLYEEEAEDDVTFPTYEEALELALQEGIKIVKLKNK